MSQEKRPSYDPHAIEQKWYKYWESHDLFRTSPNPDTDPHVIVMPPPNVTGRLHMGHALQDTVQDAITRIRRMKGDEALWLPGMDHAGIATQNVVERTLKKETGQDRHALGREKFVEKVWAWKEEYGGIILQQKRRLGDSADWSKERFTMDEGFSRAVQDVFVRLYEQDLIYRGEYLINWCPVDMTAISDEEVDNVERDGHLWYIRYPLASGDGHITIATTRPETMLGDTAIAVHPEDERYAGLIGQKAVLPLVGREIPIIADDYVKSEFGAGALKVTPGHDKNDFEIGQKHGLEIISIMNPDSTINEHGGTYEGMDRFDARKKIVEDLETAGLLEKIEEYRTTVPISSRSKAVIEPLISRQWFVRMKPLAEPALEAVRDGTIKFHPKRWENEYFRWLENIRDWTISRQLWWGHRIPVWYWLDVQGEIDESKGFKVSVDQPEPGMVQDEDVLDTWFSSWLWPFATLGWPNETEDLKYFYPGSVLVSGYDILFFWIARMIMAGLHFTGEPPYRDIFITGMIKDKHGRWMSKSLGNGIDPLEMIEQYGADAVRFSLTILCAQGQDIKLDPTRFEMGRNFANKIWNAFNVFGQFREEGQTYARSRSFEDLSLVERWMVSRVNQTIAAVEEDLERYRLNEALTRIYTLFWGDYCDWFLELVKPPYGEQMDRGAIALASDLFDTMLHLLHPFMPFITEDLWWQLRGREDGESLMHQAWPQADTAEVDGAAVETFALIQEMISGMRNVKSRYGVGPGKEIAATISVDNQALATELEANADYFTKLARVSDLTVGVGMDRPKASAAFVVGAHQVYVPLAGMVDLDAERDRLRKEIEQKEKFLAGVTRKLQNEQFVSKAPPAVVEKERQKASDARVEVEKLQATLAELG
ncbi:MAG: valine--tRNA ligase [Rhodothermales bacterium]|nr:valine--tRNA ligase [Rhodothermales bacterium]MBO6781205.1 valine--tRNA ligase [Rhodothermales bacterium]